MPKQTLVRKYDRIRLPDAIERLMKWWRMGATAFPAPYTDFHLDLARKRLEKLKVDPKWIVHKSWVETDGWCDGMRVLHAIIETSRHSMMKVKWCDSGQCFFVQMQSGGWCSLVETV